MASLCISRMILLNIFPQKLTLLIYNFRTPSYPYYLTDWLDILLYNLLVFLPYSTLISNLFSNSVEVIVLTLIISACMPAETDSSCIRPLKKTGILHLIEFTMWRLLPCLTTVFYPVYSQSFLDINLCHGVKISSMISFVFFYLFPTQPNPSIVMVYSSCSLLIACSQNVDCLYLM